MATAKNASRRIRVGPRFFPLVRGQWWTLIKLNLLFLLFCLPIVTIPAAMTALTQTTLLLAQGKLLYLWDEFWRCLKRELLPALPIGLFVLGASILALFGAVSYYSLLSQTIVAFLPLVGSLFVLVMVLMMSPYLFAQQALVELRLRTIFLNALRFTVCSLPRNLLGLLLKTVLPIAILLFPPLILLIFLGLFSLEALISAIVVLPSLDKFCRTPTPSPERRR